MFLTRYILTFLTRYILMFLCKIYLTNYVPNIENYDSTFYEISQYEKLITKLGHLSIIPPRMSKRAKRKYCSKVSCLTNISSSEHQFYSILASYEPQNYSFLPNVFSLGLFWRSSTKLISATECVCPMALAPVCNSEVELTVPDRKQDKASFIEMITWTICNLEQWFY